MDMNSSVIITEKAMTHNDRGQWGKKLNKPHPQGT